MNENDQVVGAEELAVHEMAKYVRPKPVEFDLSRLNDPKPNKIEHDKTCKFDWGAMRTEYINSKTLTYRMLAEKYGCAEVTVKIRAAKEEWVGDRKKVENEFVRRTSSENMRRNAKKVFRFNEDSLDLANKAQRLLNHQLDLAEEGEITLDPNQIGHITRAGKTAQEIGRLAMGLTTSSSEITGKDGAPLSGEKPPSMDELNAELKILLDEVNQGVAGAA